MKITLKTKILKELKNKQTKRYDFNEIGSILKQYVDITETNVHNF